MKRARGTGQLVRGCRRGFRSRSPVPARPLLERASAMVTWPSSNRRRDVVRVGNEGNEWRLLAYCFRPVLSLFWFFTMVSPRPVKFIDRFTVSLLYARHFWLSSVRVPLPGMVFSSQFIPIWLYFTHDHCPTVSRQTRCALS